MLTFDSAQRAVLGLNPRAHARVVGAPGTGKSTLIVAAFAQFAGKIQGDEADVMVLATNRTTAARLRAQIEREVDGAMSGAVVRTPTSLAFALVSRERAAEGLPQPRLITGAAHDEAIARAIATITTPSQSVHSFRSAGSKPLFTTEVFESERFRTELREFARVLDDGDLDPGHLAAQLGNLLTAESRVADQLPDPSLIERWLIALEVCETSAAILAAERPHELTASGYLRAAAQNLREHLPGSVHVPKLILVDDAQNLGEGDLALLAGCAAHGSSIWVFGDPDTAVGAFRGERTLVLSRLSAELERRGAPQQQREQSVVLTTVYRHGAHIRSLIQTLSGRVGARMLGEQRAALSAQHALEEGVPGVSGAPGAPTDSSSLSGVSAAQADEQVTVEFARAASPMQQVGALAYRLKAWQLGLLGEPPIDWSEMAVVCRSREEVKKLARALAERNIPTTIAAGGVVFKEQPLVRDLVRLVQDACEVEPLDARTVLEILTGPLGGIDVVTIRRLRHALLIEERRIAREHNHEPRAIDERILEGIQLPGDRPIIDSRGGRAVRRLGLMLAAGRKVAAAGGTLRESLWAIWQASGLATQLQDEALDSTGSRSEAAHRALDAVVALFFKIQRHEEQSSEQAVDELLTEVLTSGLAEDTLAQNSHRPEVTVTTAEGALGTEYEKVVVVGPQDGTWPNLRTQGALLGVATLERWLMGAEPRGPERRETLHDELRLFVLACSRARQELVVVSVHDEHHHPGPFFALGSKFERETPLPSANLTLRGAVAQMRRRLTAQPKDQVALATLAELSQQGIRGAHPNEWYGVLEPSSVEPLVNLERDEEARVDTSPSQLERAEECALSWVLNHLGATTSSAVSELGTLVHGALEQVPDGDVDALEQVLVNEWHKLRFDAQWESERSFEIARSMIRGLSDYLRVCEDERVTLAGQEAKFAVDIGRARLAGTVDRIELRTNSDGEHTAIIVDLKSSSNKPSAHATENHRQLQAYQLGMILGAFDSLFATLQTAPANGGARLLFVHPKATGVHSFTVANQQPLDPAHQSEIVERISQIAHTMAGATFTAQVEHHCNKDFSFGACSLHIIPAVSAS